MNDNENVDESKMECESLDSKSEKMSVADTISVAEIAFSHSVGEQNKSIGSSSIKNGGVSNDNCTKLKRRRIILNQNETSGHDDEYDSFAPAAKYRELEATRKFSIEDFSDEVLFEIVKYLDTWTLMSLMNCSARLNNLVLDHRLWTFIDLKKAPLPLGILEDILERSNVNTKVIRIRGPPISQHLEKEGIQFSKTLADTFSSRCTNLVELELQGITIDIRYVRFSDFPKTLERLRLIQCAVRIPGNEKSIFSGLDTHLKQLEELALEYNDWFEPYFIMMLSKVPKLRKLSLKGCNALVDFVPYGSMAARFGFKALEILDLRFTPISDSDLQCFNAVRTLKEILLDCPGDMRKNVQRSSAKQGDGPNTSKPDTSTSPITDTSTRSPLLATTSCGCPGKKPCDSPSSSGAKQLAEKAKAPTESEAQKPNVPSIDLDGPSTSAAALLSCRVRVSLGLCRTGEQPESSNSGNNGNDSQNSRREVNSNEDLAEQARRRNQPQLPLQHLPMQHLPPQQVAQLISQFDDSTSNSSSSSSSSSDSSPASGSIANSPERNLYPLLPMSSVPRDINGDPQEMLRECNIRPDQIILLDVLRRRGQHLRPMIRFRHRPNPIRHGQQNNNPNSNSNSPNNNNGGFEQVVNHPMFWNMLNPIGRSLLLESQRGYEAVNGQGGGGANGGGAGGRGAGGGGNEPWGVGNNVFGRIRVGRGPCISIYHKDFTPSRRKPISDRGVCSFGRPRHPVDQHIIWISVASRPSETSLERISVRNYEQVTDITLKHLVQCSPNLVYLDLSGTSVTLNGIQRFKQLKPNCKVIADHLVMDSAFNDSDDDDDFDHDEDDNDDGDNNGNGDANHYECNDCKILADEKKSDETSADKNGANENVDDVSQGRWDDMN